MKIKSNTILDNAKDVIFFAALVLAFWNTPKVIETRHEPVAQVSTVKGKS